MLLAVLLALSAWSAYAAPRPFPPGARNGWMTAGPDFTQVVINGQSLRLAPGAQIKGRQNTIVMPTSCTNQACAVKYTVDQQGMIDRVWILTDEEIRATQ
ncbi:MAG: hypothetical protein JO269_13255 [Burkholderiaceae bacterium]|nr:hypothetical protein [Burkholderiaceae bacterium]